jgi:hypothetical protein
VSGSPYLLGVVGAAAVLVLVLELLRRRHLRGKYAVLWLVLSIVMAVCALFPDLLATAAHLVGVQTPINLLFFGGTLVMLAVIMQLSYESGRLEEETRTLAEEVALLRFELEEQRRGPEGAGE